MLNPDNFLKNFKERFMTWDSFQGNKFKNIRESWVVAHFLRTYNKFYNLNYCLLLPTESNSIPDVKGCIDNLNNKTLNFEIGEVLLDGTARAEKYKNLTDEPVCKEIGSNPEAVKVVRNNLLNLLREKMSRDYGKNVFLLLYFNPSCDAGLELFFDKEKIIENFIKEKDFIEILNANNSFQEIWLLIGRMSNVIGGYSQIICIFPDFKVINIPFLTSK